MRLSTDDSLHAYRPRLVDLQGWQVWFQLRYDTWKCLLASTVGALVLFALLPGLSASTTVVWALVAGVLVTTLVIREVDGDRSLRGVLELAAHEVRCALAYARRDRGRVERWVQR